MAVTFFNEQWYLARNPDVKEAVEQGGITAEQHFEQYGVHEGRSPSPLFDSAYYLQQNPDVADAVEAGDITAYQHFEMWGHTEGRAASPYFNPTQYLANNPDLADMPFSAYEHYQSYGMDEGRAPLSSFNLEHYLLANPDVATAVGDNPAAGVRHFLTYGVNEDRSLNAVVSVAAYLAANLDVKEAVEAGHTTGLAHLLSFGITEGRDLGNGVSAAQFANDPVYKEAIEQGDTDAALARMAEVAPFLPEFNAPEGFELPADWPIPQDFAPLEGTQLTVPEGWTPAEPVQLPDYFEQPFAVAVGPGGVVHFPDATGDIHLVNLDGQGAFAQGNFLGNVTVSLNRTATIDLAAEQVLVGAFGDVGQLNITGAGAVRALGTEGNDTIDASDWNVVNLTIEAGKGDDAITFTDSQTVAGGEGADTFVVVAEAGVESSATIQDYRFDQGDVIDVTQIEGFNLFTMEVRGGSEGSAEVSFGTDVANLTLTGAGSQTLKFAIPEQAGYEQYTTLQINISEGGVLRADDEEASALRGGDGGQILVSGNQADLLSGGAGTDTFVVRDAAKSNLTQLDHIVDFAVGEDVLVSHTYVGAGNFFNPGQLADLEADTLAEALSADTFTANSGAHFTVETDGVVRTFVVLNDSTAGFDATSDTVIEMTGYTGDLAGLSVIGVPDLSSVVGSSVEALMHA